MKCVNPYVKIISKGDPFANPPVLDRYVAFPCGKCIACRINKKREWTLRLQHETAFADSAYFITLTYDDEHLPLDENGLNCPNVRDIQLFLKRLRKHYKDSKIRYMINSEYGEEFKRIHYHGIIFNLPSDILDGATIIKRKSGISYHSQKFEDFWQCGNAEIADICPERIAYTCQYFVDKSILDGYKPSISVMSRGYGIGKIASEKLSDKVRFYNLKSLKSHTGNPVSIPRYYKNKIYTDEERKDNFKEFVDGFSFSEQDLIRMENSKTVELIRRKVIQFNKRKHKL